jgi:hypothetical protein
MKFPGFVGPSYVSQSKNADDERCVNLYVEILESAGAKSRMALYPTPGFTPFAIPSPAVGRGCFAQDGRAFAVIGFAFYEVFADATLTLRGTVAADSAPATISSNGDGGQQLFITSGGKGYCYDLVANTLSSEIAGLSASYGAYLDGFFLALDTTTSTLRSSELYDGSSWPVLLSAQRTAGADRWVAMAVIHREIWLFGSETTEVWYNTGAFPFPFSPRGDAFTEQGAGAAFSIAHVNESLIWFSRNAQGDGMVLRASGYQPQRISTHALEYAISQYSRTDDAEALAYQDQGHTFYVLTFPTADATWAYDDSTGFWIELGYWDTARSRFRAWTPQCHMVAFGRHLVVDRALGIISTMDVDTATEADGSAIRRVRRAPHLTSELKRTSYQAGFQLDMQVGMGLVTGQGSDPQVMLKWSDDGGNIWSNEHWVTAGAIGTYRTRVKWTRLGSARDRVFEVAMSDPVPWRIVDAFFPQGVVVGVS